MVSSYQEYLGFARRIGLVAATNIFLALQQVLLIPILTKNLPVADYGIWVQIIVAIGLITSVIMLGLPYTMVRFLAAESSKDEIREGFYSIAGVIFCTSIITSVFLWFFSDYFAALLFNGNVFAVKILAIIVFFESMISIIVNVFRTFQQIKRYSLLLIFKNLLNLTLISLLISFHFGLIGALLGFLISDIISFTIIYLFIYHEIGFYIPLFSKIKEYLAFGLPTIPSNFSSWIVTASNRFVIGIFLGASFVGYFNPGVQLANVISMLTAPISFLLPAALSKYHDECQPEKVATLMEYSLKFLLMITIPAAFGLAILSKPILTILSTPEIASEGYLVTPIVVFGGIFMCIYVILMQVFILKKRTMITAKIWMFAAVFTLAANIVLIPTFGILGAALTYSLTYLLVLIVTYLISRKYITFNLNLSYIGKYIFASLAMSTLILVYSPHSLLQICIFIGFSIPIYFMFLFLLKGIKTEEIHLIRELVKI